MPTPPDTFCWASTVAPVAWGEAAARDEEEALAKEQASAREEEEAEENPTTLPRDTFLYRHPSRNNRYPSHRDNQVPDNGCRIRVLLEVGLVALVVVPRVMMAVAVVPVTNRLHDTVVFSTCMVPERIVS
jgi:hypothetical protein